MPNYPGISSDAFKHPLDRQAEQTLRSVPGFDLVAKKFIEFVAERPQYVYHLGSSIKVGPRQYSSIYAIFRESVKALDIDPEPSLFISQSPVANAFALGEEKPYIILNTGVLDLLTETEIRSVIAHELGHLKCGHTTLQQMGVWAVYIATLIGQATFGLSNFFISSGLTLAFYEWRRKSELSADRAALLVLDDIHPVITSMMKLAGGSTKYLHECNIDEFIKQSDNYQELDQDGLNQVYKFLLYNFDQSGPLTHPFAVERVKYLREWSKSPEYQNIKNGNYHQSSQGSIEVPSQSVTPEQEELRKQIAELQAEIERRKKASNS